MGSRLYTTDDVAVSDWLTGPKVAVNALILMNVPSTRNLMHDGGRENKIITTNEQSTRKP